MACDDVIKLSRKCMGSVVPILDDQFVS